MDEPYTYDAFISYSYRDKDRVHPIVEALKKRGLRVFLDTESIPIGESLTVALERALSRTRTISKQHVNCFSFAALTEWKLG